MSTAALRYFILLIYGLTEKVEDEETETADEKCCCVTVATGVLLLAIYVVYPILNLISVGSDIASDVGVAYRHYIEAKYWYFGLTIGFVFAPSLLFALFMTYQMIIRKDLNIGQKLCRIVTFLLASALLSLWSIIRHMKMILYGVKILCDAQNKKEYITKIKAIKNDSNFQLQTTLRAFLESAPQFLLQLYIMLSNPPKEQNSDTVALQIVSVIFSLISLTNVVLAFQLDSKSHPSGAEFDRCFVAFEFLWWLFSISARVLAIAFFAAVFKLWVLVVCLLHAGVMTFFIIFTQPKGNFGDKIVAVFVGFIYIFCFVEYKVDFGKLGRTVVLYLLYYIFTFLQNTTMVLSSFLLAPVTYPFHLVIVVLHFVAFFLGVLFMLCYLGMLRPVQLKIYRENSKGVTQPLRDPVRGVDEGDDTVDLDI